VCFSPYNLIIKIFSSKLFARAPTKSGKAQLAPPLVSAPTLPLAEAISRPRGKTLLSVSLVFHLSGWIAVWPDGFAKWNRPKCGPIHILQNECITFTVVKRSPKFGLLLPLSLKKLKVGNRIIGENSIHRIWSPWSAHLPFSIFLFLFGDLCLKRFVLCLIFYIRMYVGGQKTYFPLTPE
jgi:hypothetical protein